MAKFEEQGNFRLPKVEMHTDKILHKNLKEPLSSIKSGSMIVISGAAGSGKSSALVNMFILGKCSKTGKKMSLKECFDNIFIVSPSMGSFKSNIFDSIEENYKYDDLLEFLETYREIINPEEEETCVILDDVGSQIRKKDTMHKFNKLIHNRRHQKLTIFVIIQNLTMIPPAVRDSVNILIFFKPKSLAEKNYVFELTGLAKKFFDEFFEAMFKQKYDCVLVDMTLTRSNNFEFYRNIFNRIKIN